MIVFNWTDAHFYWSKLHILINLIFWIFRTWKYEFKGTNIIFELTAIEFPLLGFKLTAGLWSSLLNSKFWVMNFSFQLKTMVFSIDYQFSLYKKIKKKFEKGSENWMVRKFAYQFTNWTTNYQWCELMWTILKIYFVVLVIEVILFFDSIFGRTIHFEIFLNFSLSASSPLTYSSTTSTTSTTTETWSLTSIWKDWIDRFLCFNYSKRF